MFLDIVRTCQADEGMLARGQQGAAPSPQDQEDADEARRLRQQAGDDLGGGLRD